MDLSWAQDVPWLGAVVAAVIGAAVTLVSPWRDLDGRLVESAKRKLEVAEKLAADPLASELRTSARADVQRLLERRGRTDLVLRLVCAAGFAVAAIVLAMQPDVTTWATSSSGAFVSWTVLVVLAYLGIVVFVASAGQALVRTRRHRAAAGAPVPPAATGRMRAGTVGRVALTAVVAWWALRGSPAGGGSRRRQPRRGG